MLGSAAGRGAAKEGGKPSDGGGVPPKKVSFRDKVLGGNPLPKRSLPEDLLSHNLVKIESHEGNKLRPRISFDKSVIDVISAPWRDALVIKLLGRLRSLWRL